MYQNQVSCKASLDFCCSIKNIDFSPLERSLSGLLKSTGSYYESTLKNQEEEIRNNPQNVNSNDNKKFNINKI